MSDENNNVENKQEENKTGKNRLKVKIKNIFLIFLVITAVFFFTAKTSIAEEESLYTFKDSIQNFFINREKVNKPGKWVRLKGKLSTERRRVKAHLLPDGDVLIFGGSGITFKENCPDIRNTKVVDIYHTLQEYTSNIVVYDPWANPSSVEQEYGIQIQNDNIAILRKKFDTIILAVAHNAFLDVDIREFLKNPNGVIYDVKGVLNRDIVDARL